MSRATILVARIFPDCTNAWWPQPKGASRSLWCNDRAIKPKLPHGKPQKLSPPSFIRRICLTAYMKPRSPRRSWQQPSVSWSTPCLRWPNYPSTICHTRRPQKMYSIYIYIVCNIFLKHMYFSKIYHPWWLFSFNTTALNRLKMHLQAKPRRQPKLTWACDGPGSVLVGFLIYLSGWP